MKHICKPPRYCEIIGIDILSFSEGVQAAMEEDMKKQLRDKVDGIHPYKMPTTEQWEQAQAGHKRLRTRVKDDTKLDGRKDIYGYTEEEMYINLYKHYFGDIVDDTKTFGAFFERAMDDKKQRRRIKSVDDEISDFNRFFRDDAFSKIELSKIKISDLAKFFTRAHTKVSKLDISRDQRCIERHRHCAIRTIINDTYAYANTFEDANIINPIGSLNYNIWPYYRTETLEKGWYDESDRVALLAAFDAIKEPNLEDLAAGFLIETAGRNSEVRAIRFCDFDFVGVNYGIPCVNINGMAEGSHRDDRVKADSYAGRRSLILTERLVNIYKTAKEISWSDEYMFVREPDKVIEKEILITSQGLQRGLRRLCEAAHIAYLPPHQIRFSEATLMALQENDILAIQRRMGHTTPTMAAHYLRNAMRMKPAAGAIIADPKCPQISEQIKKLVNAEKINIYEPLDACPEPESNQ